MLPYVRELADVVDREWRAEEYSGAMLPDVAYAALAKCPPPDDFGLSEILACGIRAENLPIQGDPSADFGQPPITLYFDDHFHIDAYIWRESTTTIHQHRFAGAFCLLTGSSLQCRYRFEVSDEISERIMLGTVAFSGFDLLRRGDCQRIAPGRSFIHSAYHLDHPSVSLVIRNRGQTVEEAQYKYLPPHVAYDPFYRPRSLSRRLLLMNAALVTENEAGIQVIHEVLDSADFFTVFKVLTLAEGHYRSIEKLRPMLDIARRRHGERIDSLEVVFEESVYRRDLLALRDPIRDPELRLFIAFLLNLPDRVSILEAVRLQYAGCDPIEKIAAWLRLLASPELTEPAPDDRRDRLGIGFDDFSILVLGQLLKGGDREDVVRSIEEECRARKLQVEPKRIRVACAALPNVTLTRRLFAG